jgi:hypothetical protein
MLRGLACPLCGVVVVRGEVLAHRVQVHGESASGVPVRKGTARKATKGKRKGKAGYNLPAIGTHPTLISQLHKSQHKLAKATSITGDELYQSPKDWRPPRGQSG